METIADLNQNPLVEHQLDLGRFVYYKNFSIAEISQGVHMSSENMTTLLSIAKDVYGSDIPFVYISNRIHSYSVDPLGYYEAIKMFPNLIGYAIVSQNSRRRTLAGLEKLFIKKPVRIFDHLEQAIAWAGQLNAKMAP